MRVLSQRELLSQADFNSTDLVNRFGNTTLYASLVRLGISRLLLYNVLSVFWIKTKHDPLECLCLYYLNL